MTLKRISYNQPLSASIILQQSVIFESRDSIEKKKDRRGRSKGKVQAVCTLLSWPVGIYAPINGLPQDEGGGGWGGQPTGIWHREVLPG